jgi:hypothetical protein
MFIRKSIRLIRLCVKYNLRSVTFRLFSIYKNDYFPYVAASVAPFWAVLFLVYISEQQAYLPSSGLGFKAGWRGIDWLSVEGAEYGAFSYFLPLYTLSLYKGKRTECPRWVDSIPVSYSGGPRIISLSEHRLFWLRFFVISFSPSRQSQGNYFN